MDETFDEYAIENTTKSQRIAIIKQWEEEDGCESSGMNLMEFYRDYIDGKKSIRECNAAFSASYISEILDDEDTAPKCGMGGGRFR